MALYGVLKGGVITAIVNAKQYCDKTGFPLATLRAFCREGKIKHWKRGQVYWFDEASAEKELEGLQDFTIPKPRQKAIPKSKEFNHRRSAGFNYHAEINRRKQECKKAKKEA